MKDNIHSSRKIIANLSGGWGSGKRKMLLPLGPWGTLTGIPNPEKDGDKAWILKRK